MTHKFSSKLFLTFIICLMPFSTYSVDPSEPVNEQSLYKDFLTVMEKATNQASKTGSLFLGAISLLNCLVWMDNSYKTEEERNDYIPLFSSVAIATIIGALCGFSEGYSEVLKPIS